MEPHAYTLHPIPSHPVPSFRRPPDLTLQPLLPLGKGSAAPLCGEQGTVQGTVWHLSVDSRLQISVILRQVQVQVRQSKTLVCF